LSEDGPSCGSFSVAIDGAARARLTAPLVVTARPDRLEIATPTTIGAGGETRLRHEAAFGCALHHAVQVGDGIGTDCAGTQARIEFVEQGLRLRGPRCNETQDRSALVRGQARWQH
jgi:hypothetical protein